MDVEPALTTIRAALASDATSDARAAGASACRAILTALEGTAATAPTIAPPALNPAAIASAISALRGVPPEQLLDLAIAKLRAAVPPGVTLPAITPFKLPLVPIPR